MVNEVIANCIKNKLNKLDIGDNAIVVLKGIPLPIVDESVDKINLEDIIANKLGYFMSIFEKRHYLSYEEFLLLSDFIVAQYKEVHILNNNIYIEQFPITECFSDGVRSGLLAHFEDSNEGETDNRYIGDIDEYISIFEGLKEHNGCLVGVYRSLPVLQNQKVITVDIFEDKEYNLSYCEEQPDNFIEIIDETDYVSFVKLLINEPAKIYMRISNYAGNTSELKKHIALAMYYWQECTEIRLLQTQEFKDEYFHCDEYNDILSRYWGYSSFRNLSVYDINSLERGEKDVKEVSQENIIANLIREAEKCGDGENFRDIFVTAPTGAGKSVMFQIPAIYLAEKYNLLTIVISPLIGLMNDQVRNLELKNYPFAKTINSDISPIIKQDIINKIANSKYHILYLSPETLLSRSDVEQLIGGRTIGMIIVDEAHIVTTWGKQFRPDYWYLGDHIRKLRKQQLELKGRSFVIGTFTATAIYHGVEDMYTETVNSLHMLNPITYLGYVKRRDIEIVIKHPQKGKNVRSEYELDKFEQIESIIQRAIITNKKALIYFPTIRLIEQCYEYLRSNQETKYVTLYHGALNKDAKQENYEQFLSKEKLIMLATKAFGMGIDINDIELVVHFAPTGNVCDYVQEIGRAARRDDLRGEALYYYNSRDFKHINRLHGLSSIKKYQLINTIRKINELYQQNIRNNRRDFTKKRNAMLLDAENFSYIFGTPTSDEDNNINKVKTALLLIQKDFESKLGFSPITVRPIPMFSVGFFAINPDIQNRLLKRYPNSVEEIDHSKHICRVLLSTIWEKDYKTLSFPKFKYLLYTKNQEKLDFVSKYSMESALCVEIMYTSDYLDIFKKIWKTLKGFIGRKVISSEHTAISQIVSELSLTCGLSKYKSQTICEVVIASMDSYRKNFARTSTPIVSERTTNDGTIKYRFNVAVNSYFRWVESYLQKIKNETYDGRLYIINDNRKQVKQYNIILGVLESMGILTFKMIGGANSQLYIYINQALSLRNIVSNPSGYNNRLLEAIAERHLLSVKMLTYLYEGNFTSDESWNLIEDYFLGKIPEKVKNECRNNKPNISFE